MGGGTVQKKDGTAHNLADVNTDLNSTQEITLDQQTGGLDATVTVDHRWASSEGRNNIANNFVDTYEHGQDIGRTVSAVANEDGLGILNFGEALDKNAKGTQLKNDLLRNSENAHILAGLQSEDAEQYAQAMQALGQLAQNKFGLELSDINLYDASKTDSLSLADTALVNVKGGTVVDQNNQEYGNIFIDAGDGASKTDMTQTLGHEVIETQALQGKNGGLTNGLLGTNSAETKEAMANLFGAQLADRMNQAAGGELNSSGGANFASNLQNSQAVVAGTQRADNVGTAEVEHRQFKHIESRMLDQARDQIKNDPTLTVSEKKDKIEQLEAVACASIQCGAGVPARDSKHNEIAGIQQFGEQLIQDGANLYAMLHELGVDTPTTNNGRMQRKTETSFGYSGQDALTDALTRNLTPAVDGINTAADAALTLVTAGAVGPVVDAANAINGNPSGEGFTAYLAEQAGEGFNTAWEMPSHVGAAVLNSFSEATWEDTNYFGDAALAALELTGVGKLSSDALKAAGPLLRGSDDVAGTAATQARREGDSVTFDEFALEGQRRQQQMLDDNTGYNVSRVHTEKYAEMGNPKPDASDGSRYPEGGQTFLTDRQAFELNIGKLSASGGVIKVTREQADSLAYELGMRPGQVGTGSIIRQVENIRDLNPASPIDVKDPLFRGAGQHLPNGSPELNISPAQLKSNNPNVINEWKVEVLE